MRQDKENKPPAEGKRRVCGAPDGASHESATSLQGHHLEKSTLKMTSLNVNLQVDGKMKIHIQVNERTEALFDATDLKANSVVRLSVISSGIMSSTDMCVLPQADKVSTQADWILPGPFPVGEHKSASVQIEDIQDGISMELYLNLSGSDEISLGDLYIGVTCRLTETARVTDEECMPPCRCRRQS
ncbi:uncharacterized protein LOC135826828 isoform X1 [Sycon ciliatum]|uniref:uncharacterized protein LOC135826828 isoform X1 n=2 Tax=Sycon ciliatum TaxID=27933 RepID=UPI0031F69411